MCGIFALLNINDDSNVLQQFLKGRARGPESSILTSPISKCKMGFHRLAISSLNTSANQPLEVKNCILICNGEIYNNKYLFQLINKENISSSDCEIIIHLYLKYGIEHTLNLLDGVFAFVLLDKKKKSIYVARDTFGVRPLFVMENDYNHIGFASEIKMFDNDEESSFIKPFLPGTYSKYSYELLGKKKSIIPSQNKIKHWTKKISNKVFSSSNCTSNDSLETEEDVFASITKTLQSAVKKRVLNCQNRPIACCLSGGLDSSLITAMVNQYVEQLETYSIGIHGSEDLKYAKIMAEFLGTKHTQIELTEKEFLDAIPETIKAIESYDTTTVRASVGNYLVSKYISEHSQAKIIFNGDGSDEVCGGYMYFHCAPDALAFDVECRRLLKDIHYFDVLRSDRSISSNGLEARTPFLDKTFVLHYLSIPPHFRHHAGKNQCEKYLLRKAFEPLHLLPPEILWRKKEAFSDGVSSQKKSWYEVIQEYVQTKEIQAIIKNEKKITHNIPETDEQKYYRQLFEQYYPNHSNVIPYFWMPRFIKAKDSSARTLDIYNKI